MLFDVLVGADQAEDLVGELAQRGPGLLTVDDVVVPIADGARLEAGQIGAGTRLGIALTPPVFTGQDARQDRGFLLLGAELDQHRAEHVEAEGDRAGGVGAGTLFLEDMHADRVPVRAAVLDRPTWRQPTLCVQGGVPVFHVVAVQIAAIANLGGQLFGQVALQEVADFLAEGFFLGGEIQIHDVSPRAFVSTVFRTKARPGLVPGPIRFR